MATKLNPNGTIDTQSVNYAKEEKILGEEMTYVVEATGSEAKHIIDLLQAEAQGRIVILPCKIGDVVYIPDNGVSKYSITGYTEGVCAPLIFQATIIEYGDMNVSENEEFEASEIGKTVFLTREEAEEYEEYLKSC